MLSAKCDSRFFPETLIPESSFMQKPIRLALLCAVLLLATYLRTTGLTWGLTSGFGIYRNFHPDEFLSLSGVLELDLLKGQIKAPRAYSEGTFNYYLWALPQAALKLSNKTQASSTSLGNMENHASLLYACRWMSVLFDLCTLIIVFLTVREATQDFYPALLGALCYAVLPMQVIYSHFMRPHLLSNLLCALVIWFSLKLCKRRRWWMLLTVGFLSGLGLATRYPVGIIVIIPCLYLLFDCYVGLPDWKTGLWERAKGFVSGAVWLLGLGFVLGLLVGHPMLFWEPRSVIDAVKGSQLSYASLGEFMPGKLLNLSTLWKYISLLIPVAMYPVLWLLPYVAICYLCLRPELFAKSLPLLLFSLLYLYFMAKGYLVPIFARPTMLLFPGFCILLGLACGDLLLRLKKQRIAVVLLTSIFFLLVVPSIVFDVAYVQAMQRKDSRFAIREDLQKLIDDSPATIGILRNGGFFYTVIPAVEPLRSDKVEIQLQDPGEKADFFVVGFTRPIDPNGLDASIKRIEAQGRFRYEKSYTVRPQVFGREFQLAHFPPDMTYPFPTLLLFRAKTET
jgi:hypothetical protein